MQASRLPKQRCADVPAAPVVASLHCQHPLAPEQVSALLTQQPAQPLLQLLHVASTNTLDAYTADAAVVLMLLVLLQARAELATQSDAH